MRNLKKLLALALALALVFSLTLPAMAATIGEATDAADAKAFIEARGDLADVYEEAVQMMLDLGIVTGTSANGIVLELNRAYNRIEFCTMLYRAMNGRTDPTEAEKRQKSLFTDIPDDHWGKAYANWAVTTGVFKGTSLDPTKPAFSPDDPITETQAFLTVMRALGLDDVNMDDTKVVWNGTESLTVLQLALRFKLYDNFYADDSEQLVRGEACFLIWTLLNASRIEYAVATGKASLKAGDEGYLLETAFNLSSATITVLSDGKWVDLTDGTPGTDNKGIVSVYRDDAARGNITLSVALTEQLGINYDKIGHSFSILYRKNASSENIDQLFSFKQVTSEKIMTDLIANTSGTIRGALLDSINNATGKDFSAAPAYDNIKINFNDPLVELQNDGRSGVGSLQKIKPSTATFTYATGATSVVWTTAALEAAYTSGVEAAFEATTYGDASGGAAAWTGGQKIRFAIWVNNQVSTSQVNYSGKSLIDVSNIILDFTGYNFNHANTKVIYDDDGIKYVFIESYVASYVDEIDSDSKLQLKNAIYNGPNFGDNVETKNIKDIEAQTWAEDDLVLTYRIGTAKYGIKPVTTVVEGKVTAASADGKKITINGSTYEVTSMNLRPTATAFANGSGVVTGAASMVGADKVVYLLNGRMIDIQDPAAAPAPDKKYAVVIDSEVVKTSSSTLGGGTEAWEYWVKLMLDDGSTFTGQLTSNKVAGEEITKTAGVIKTSSYSSGINDKLFIYTITNDKVALSSASATAMAEVSTASVGTVTVSGVDTKFDVAYPVSELRNLYLLPGTIIFLKAPDGNYRFIKGLKLPAIDLTGTSSAADYSTLNGQFIKGKAVVANDAVAVMTLVIGEAGTGSTAVLPDDAPASSVAIALGGYRTEYVAAFSEARQAVDILTKDGVKTVYGTSTGDTTISTATPAKGKLFTVAINADNEATTFTAYSTDVTVSASNKVRAINTDVKAIAIGASDPGTGLVYDDDTLFYYVNGTGDSKKIAAADVASYIGDGHSVVTYAQTGGIAATNIVNLVVLIKN